MKRNTPKIKHIINWNIITLIITTGVIILGIFLNYNKREIDIYKAELAKVEKENNELKSKLDPEWYSKLNNQRNYYESELSVKETAILEIKKQKDSIENSNAKAKLDNADNLVLPIKVARKIAKKLIEGQRDSALLSVNLELLDNYKQMDSGLRKIIESRGEQVNILKTWNLNNEKIIKIYSSAISEYEDQSKLLSLLLLINIVIFISALLAWIKSKKNVNKLTSLV